MSTIFDGAKLLVSQMTVYLIDLNWVAVLKRFTKAGTN